MKTIGDAAMLVAPDAQALLDTTLELVGKAGRIEGFPQLRAGAAYGPALYSPVLAGTDLSRLPSHVPARTDRQQRLTQLHFNAHVTSSTLMPQIARVAVEDERWLAFRQAALAQGISVSAYLGRLVERELRRRQGRAVEGVSAEAPERDQALVALADVRAAIDELDGIAGRLARTAVAHGGSWDEVAGSLRLEPEQARSAYDG